MRKHPKSNNSRSAKELSETVRLLRIANQKIEKQRWFIKRQQEQIAGAAKRNAIELQNELKRLRAENNELIDALFVKDDEIRQLFAYKSMMDDGHAYRIAQRLHELKYKKDGKHGR